MSTATRAIIEKHWEYANARDWQAFGKLLDPALRYEVPQTREYIETGAGYLDMFQTWPGDWTARVKHLVCEGSKSVCIIDFIVCGEIMTGVSVFETGGERIVAVTDYWPESYEPPPRQSAHMKRRPA